MNSLMNSSIVSAFAVKPAASSCPPNLFRYLLNFSNVLVILNPITLLADPLIMPLLFVATIIGLLYCSNNFPATRPTIPSCQSLPNIKIALSKLLLSIWLSAIFFVVSVVLCLYEFNESSRCASVLHLALLVLANNLTPSSGSPTLPAEFTLGPNTYPKW